MAKLGNVESEGVMRIHGAIKYAIPNMTTPDSGSKAPSLFGLDW